MDAEWRTVHTRAPALLRPLLVGDVRALEPKRFRDALVAMASCQTVDPVHGYVWPERKIWLLRAATATQFAACTPEDFEPLLADEDPEIPEAALLAIWRTHPG